MAYVALYRTYRPKNFGEVIGQKHIIKTLKNAVAENKTSHAYIFSGLRGIGKTTIARILARAVNCENPIDGEPCNQCKNCLAILNDETTDIVATAAEGVKLVLHNRSKATVIRVNISFNSIYLLYSCYE